MSAASARLVVDRVAHSICLTRMFEAPATQVFEAWTRPEHVRCWWDPAGEPLATCEIDLRPGGAFSFASASHAEYPFAGTYLEISPPDRLVFEAMGAQGTVTLTAAGRTCHMMVTIACRSAEQLDQFLQRGIDTGTARTLDNLVTYLGVPAGAAA